MFAPAMQDSDPDAERGIPAPVSVLASDALMLVDNVFDANALAHNRTEPKHIMWPMVTFDNFEKYAAWVPSR